MSPHVIARLIGGAVLLFALIIMAASGTYVVHPGFRGVPEQSAVQIYKQFAGDPFDSLIAPRVQEAIKEVTAMQTAVIRAKGRCGGDQSSRGSSQVES